MSMNEKQIVGESFDDLSDNEMALLTGRGNDDVAPASSLTVTIPISPYLITGGITATLSLAGKCHK
ncbi:lichenicidin A2 family type 2 lantibiotic [Bifidobacterium aesculapii]|uniref:lichenicidin A2 family type 2 lantibiotic n=1 Tax=Bifidobacterium aesculapii TaxID=1329411 RepID=UPI0006E17A39|nr:lichenicidin A2 family type 2 lantibiotic [Bifidobacterium aesculapii]